MGAHPTDVVCMFCNRPIADGQEACVLTIRAEWTDSDSTYWCHGACLQAATHPQIPLYLLSLRRDEAVYGTESPET